MAKGTSDTQMKCQLYAGELWIGLGIVTVAEKGYRYGGSLSNGLASLGGNDLVLKITSADDSEIEYPVITSGFIDEIGSYSGMLSYRDQ